MKHYVKLDENSIVVATLVTKKSVGKEWLEVDYSDDKLGKKWNGSTFEDVPKEDVEEPRVVTMEDLEDYLLTLIELNTTIIEKEEA